MSNRIHQEREFILKLTALKFVKDNCLAEAVRIFPEYEEFLRYNQSKDLNEVRAELLQELPTQ